MALSFVSMVLGVVLSGYVNTAGKEFVRAFIVRFKNYIDLPIVFMLLSAICMLSAVVIAIFGYYKNMVGYYAIAVLVPCILYLAVAGATISRDANVLIFEEQMRKRHGSTKTLGSS